MSETEVLLPLDSMPAVESWRKVWREGVAPILSDKSLVALQTALREDRAELIQGSTVSPPPMRCVQDWPVEGACALGYCGWQGEGLQTVGEVEEFFAKVCYAIDQQLGEPAGCRWFLNWFDETPRPEMRTALLSEIKREQVKRKMQAASPGHDGSTFIHLRERGEKKSGE
jgi:hypothetical protein